MRSRVETNAGDRREMNEVDAALAALSTAIQEFADSMPVVDEDWRRRPADDSWSSSQIVEHVARSLEESAKVVAGEASGLPRLPGPLRWLLRVVFVRRILRGGRFPRGRTVPVLDPEFGPESAEEGRRRLDEALERMVRSCRSPAASNGVVQSPIVGRLGLADFLRLQAGHVRHHRAQLRRGARESE